MIVATKSTILAIAPFLKNTFADLDKKSLVKVRKTNGIPIANKKYNNVFLLPNISGLLGLLS